MSLLADILLPLGLLVLAGVMIDHHRRVWRDALADGKIDGRTWRFERRRYRRRMLASGAIGGVGLLLAVRRVVPEDRVVYAAYLGLLLLACLLMIVLAAIDALASSMHYRVERNRRLAEHARQTEQLLQEYREANLEDEAN